MKLVATSSGRPGTGDELQGEVYLIDLENRAVEKRRPGKRKQGLRGIAFDDEIVYLAGGDELFAYTPNFRLIESWRNPYLREARETAIHERTLYVVSAGCDGVLGFDLDARRFHWAMHVATREHRFAARRFDPHGKAGPLIPGKLELDSIHCNGDGMYLGGLRAGGMLHFNGKRLHMAAELPAGSHNARPFRDGVLFNDTEAGALRYSGRDDGLEDRAMRVPTGEAVGADSLESGFARGLCVISDSVVAGGSSPAAVTLYDLAGNRQLLSVTLAEEPAEAIHSIAVWPYD